MIHHRTKRGFSLVELLVVIAIIALIAAIILSVTHGIFKVINGWR
ncbi:MAG TPA: prepilin-type N-terminal cleavage/methylation domain-containing protein [Humisphaera sp.]|nr:prepilin-type N-terminal cleavage/methylation domain-containing protein [Humisphaera sp.]